MNLKYKIFPPKAPACPVGGDQPQAEKLKAIGGFSLIEAIIAIAIFGILTSGIYMSYSNVLDVSVSSRLRKAALAVIRDEIELIRNLPYASVGIQGGFPAGVLPAQKNAPYGATTFVINTFVRNTDDPFDGQLGGVPNDTAPADYKLVTVRATCPTCPRFTTQKIELTTIVAPKALEGASINGNLFINVFDALGDPVSGANVVVENSVHVPPITISDETNTAGILQLVDIPTSIVSYEITVSKGGYSSERTYSPGEFGESDPVKLHSTVVQGTITEISFAIDRVGSIAVNTNDKFCAPVGSFDFELVGSKVVATNPNVLKYSEILATDETGSKPIQNLEWDTYSFTPADGVNFLSGFSPPALSINLDPAESYLLSGVTESRNLSGILISTLNSAGQGEDDALINLTKIGFDRTLLSGRRTFTETDWSAGQYGESDGGIATTSPAGDLHLLANGLGQYSTTTESWLTSRTIDFGTSNATTYYLLSWNPSDQPPGAGLDSLHFQVAANNDNATWNFAGPDGTSSTYYTASGSAINAGYSNNRFFRYKVFMKTVDEQVTPLLNDVTVEFSSACVPDGQAFFNGLDAGTYNVSVTKAGFDLVTTTVTVGVDAWANGTVTLNPTP